ncbi:uncharacterized protein TRIADDRAFT_54276 [Trichoplax adhaerens]|uniref:Uromodulin n=1 Tax=Trichoplax adhaerens TaxID=10228 RepID=B3RRK6_TRIAD|nr:hypothetical protein TRIADDRAFT_54276 [Trichoplax adhaerens]EDV26364.1 hypothetical protein TRIADDRAFT_54276 [Trichoplax adhaerens]|eukprot:XP_002110360.1 hypothetical protein TRIADDRAFT_54276 [Trichoplax adhaerens]
MFSILSISRFVALLSCTNLLYGLIPLVILQQAIGDDSCYDKETLGRNYNGNVNFTKTGARCQSWSQVSYYNFDHNYCRNPDLKDGGPWCYYSNAISRYNNSWDYCPIPPCKWKDIDRCSNSNGGCSHICLTTQSSYYCSCPKGLRLASDDKQCEDINECDYDDVCEFLCLNTYGSYKCSCPKGYSINANQCLDIDECKSDRNICSHNCHNIHGSFLCYCPSNLTLGSDKRTCINQTQIANFKPKLRIECNHDYIKNRLRNRPDHPSGLITRKKILRLAFLCSYSNQGWIGIAYNPDNKPLISHNWHKGYGNFSYFAKIYPTARYFNAFPPSAYPLPLKLNQRAYLEFGVHAGDANLRVAVENCLATPDTNISDPIHYWIIRNGCNEDKTIKKHYSKISKTVRFSIKAFSFLFNQPFIFIHCQLMVCPLHDNLSRCAQGCQRTVTSGNRIRRELGQDEKVFSSIVSVGPLFKLGN